jgi:anti-sigma regulatory factor (Ser/Thr protein kinase)
LVEIARSEKASSQPITLMVPPDITLCADQRQFQRAIENLLRNALRYAHECVVVEVLPNAAGVVVEVRDDGPGIPREQWTNVLEPFVRIDAPRSRARRGLGLGLSIVRRIVEAHGGLVTVTNASEGGTCVRTIWPSRRSAVGVSIGRRPAAAIDLHELVEERDDESDNEILRRCDAGHVRSGRVGSGRHARPECTAGLRACVQPGSGRTD